MSTELTKEQKIAKIISSLTPTEQKAYKYFLASINRKEAVEIPEGKADSLYILFQTGKSCEEIRKLNHPNYSLGQIVTARITGNWDERLEEYRKSLGAEAQEHVAQVQLESAAIIADMIACCHKMFGEHIRKYLQSGNMADLKGSPLENITFRQYSELIKTLMSVTGQDQKKTVNVQGTVIHKAESKTLSQEAAADLLNKFVPDDE